MRVNIYAEEMTERIEIIGKEIDGHTFTGLRLYLELPVTVTQGVAPTVTRQVSGPFMHRPGDDDSAAVTFWGKRDLRVVLRKMLKELDQHYADNPVVPLDAPQPQKRPCLEPAYAVPEERDNWISVKDRLPENDTSVLVWCGWVTDATYRPKRMRLPSHVWYKEPAGINPVMMITHWMPEPAPPMKEAHDG